MQNAKCTIQNAYKTAKIYKGKAKDSRVKATVLFVVQARQTEGYLNKNLFVGLRIWSTKCLYVCNHAGVRLHDCDRVESQML